MSELSDADGQQVLRWVERVSMFCVEERGLPPIAGRVLGWLMICDPPEQSAGQIATAIGASRGSLVNNLRMLTSAGIVRRHTHPGARAQFYMVDDRAWEETIRQHFATLARFRDITAAGLELAGTDSDRADRLRTAHGIFAGIVQRLAAPTGLPPGHEPVEESR